MLRLGHDSKMLVAHKSFDDRTVVSIHCAATPYKSLKRTIDRYRISHSFDPYLTSRPTGLDRFSDDGSEFATDLADGIPSAEVLNLHWVAGFIDYRELLKTYGSRIPMVWTLHDMNVFTGGCHYDEGCGKFAARARSWDRRTNMTCRERFACERKKRLTAWMPATCES